jgi:two-component system sensor histidine kinase YesM
MAPTLFALGRSFSSMALLDACFIGGLFSAFVALERGGELCRLEKSLSSLGRLYYYCEASDPYVVLGCECEMVGHYLDLQKLRFEDRLLFTVHYDSSAGAALVPRSCVLFLAQRAIEQDIETSESATTLNIRCRESTAGRIEASVGRTTRVIRRIKKRAPRLGVR